MWWHIFTCPINYYLGTVNKVSETKCSQYEGCKRISHYVSHHYSHYLHMTRVGTQLQVLLQLTAMLRLLNSQYCTTSLLDSLLKNQKLSLTNVEVERTTRSCATRWCWGLFVPGNSFNVWKVLAPTYFQPLASQILQWRVYKIWQKVSS